MKTLFSRSTGRRIHPGAWWAWAGALGWAAIETTNPVILLLLGSIIFYVVASCRSADTWSRSISYFLKFGLFVVVLRIVVQVVFAQRIAGHNLFTVPSVSLPSWAAGVSIGGHVTVELVLQATCEGLRLSILLLAFGAANSLASPYRLLRSLPAILYEAGVGITVALSYAPELVVTITTLRYTRRLRGRPTRGIAGLRGMAVPVLEGALDRSLQLASSMDARGYGRRVVLSRRARRGTTLLTTLGVILLLAGIFDLLGAATPFAFGITALLLGFVAIVLSMSLSGRRTVRTRYRPDEWKVAEWVVVFSGLCVIVLFAIASAQTPNDLQVTWPPLQYPTVPLVAVIGSLVALAPVLVTSRSRASAESKSMSPSSHSNEASTST